MDDPVDVETPGGFDVTGVVQLGLGSTLLLLWATGMFEPSGDMAQLVIGTVTAALFGSPAYQLVKEKL
jgi:hypothetical protein